MTRLRSSLLALTALATLAGLASTAQANEVKTLGLAVANLQADFFNQIKQSVEEAGKQKGIKVITVDAKGDSATQVSQVQDLLTQDIDALIYIPAGATAASVPTKAAKAAGVPVVPGAVAEPRGGRPGRRAGGTVFGARPGGLHQHDLHAPPGQRGVMDGAAGPR